MKRSLVILLALLCVSGCAKKVDIPVKEEFAKVVNPRPYAIKGLYLGMSHTLAIQQIKDNAEGEYKMWYTYQTPYYREHMKRMYLDGKTDDYVTTLRIRGMIFTNKEDSEDVWRIAIGWDHYGKVYYIEYSSEASEKFLGFDVSDAGASIEDVNDFYGIELKQIKSIYYMYDTPFWSLWADLDGNFCLYRKDSFN